ncbi:MAG: aminotransferase class V-fold PLP-dependent enzyme [Candidatus Eisenbacteria bacterium]
MSAPGLIYLDHAATAWPKAPGVARAMGEFLDRVGANPGRSGHRLSVEAGRIVYAARETIARLLGAPDPLRVIFTANATEALNIALHGLLRPGDHVITSSIEHNSMMRPLRTLEQVGVRLTVTTCAQDGSLDPEDIEAAIASDTALIALAHASNVVGTLLPIREIGEIARRHGVLLLVDAAPTAGCVPIDMGEDGIDLLAFTGHKSLYGPPGTGGLVLGNRVDARRLRPLKQGGTGSRSDREEQPEFLPDMLECGTLNSSGIAGLAHAARWVMDQGVAEIGHREEDLTRRLIAGLRGIPGVTLHGRLQVEGRTAVLSFTIEGREPSEIGECLDAEHGILCRVGLHCAPAAHRTIGTFPRGTVRFSPGVHVTDEAVDRAVEAVARLARGAGG